MRRDFSRPARRRSPYALLVALTACTMTPAVTVVRTSPGEQVEAIRGVGVKLKRGPTEALAGARGGFYVVRGHEDWQRVWPDDKAPPPPSTLDAGSQMLFVAVSDRRDVTQVKVQRAVETATFLYVWVRETTIGEFCVSKPRDPAIDAVVAARADKPVKFFVDEEPGESCGQPPVADLQCRLAGQEAWSATIDAEPADVVECMMTATARGKFALVDELLTIAELPPGSTSKLAFTKGSKRGELELDVYGTYAVSAEAVDEAGRRGRTSATIEVRPPKTKDVLVQLVWAGFDRADTSDTFPRVNLRVTEPGPRGQRCSAEIPIAGLCEVRTRGAYTSMRIAAGSRRLPVSVQFLDERVADGPGPCVHVWYDGARTAETCDRARRDADEIWKVGTLDTATGKLLVDGATTTSPPEPAADAGAPRDAPPAQ